MAKNNQRIEAFKKAELPINYRKISVSKSMSVDDKGNLVETRVIKGYGVIWDSVNDYQERFVKGCFSKSIKELGPGTDSAYKIKFRDRHGKSCSLFKVLKEDEVGLYFETVPLDDVQWADDVLVQLQSGTLNNFSIGFRHIWDRVEWDEENDCLIILEARLFEISVVDIPSDMETYAERSMEENSTLIEDVEQFIIKLPKPFQLEARTILTRCMSPISNAPAKRDTKPPKTDTPIKTGLDFNFLISNLKTK